MLGKSLKPTFYAPDPQMHIPHLLGASFTTQGPDLLKSWAHTVAIKANAVCVLNMMCYKAKYTDKSKGVLQKGYCKIMDTFRFYFLCTSALHSTARKTPANPPEMVQN